ncbi:hypothetical protein ACTXT7_005744 [Hymenolepis weldensis]
MVGGFDPLGMESVNSYLLSRIACGVAFSNDLLKKLALNANINTEAVSDNDSPVKPKTSFSLSETHYG